MRKLIILLCIGWSCMASAQNIPVTSGIGCANIKLGMSEAQVRKILGNNFTATSYEEEMKSFKSSAVHFSIDSIVQFILGFDKCLVATDKSLQKSPIFNLYFLNDSLDFIGITSYSLPIKLLNSIVLDGSLRFNMSDEACQKILGNNYLPTTYGDYTGDHVYYNKGLEMTYDANKFTFMGIFRPTPGFLELITGKREKLLKELDDLKMEK